MRVIDSLTPLPSPPVARFPIFLQNEETATIPPWVTGLETFREWARSEQFPHYGRFSFLNGGLWVDLAMEQLFTHNGVKGEISTQLNFLIRASKLGYFFFDRARLTHVAGGLSTEPDGLFLSHPSLDAGKVRLIEGSREGLVEVEGTPDWVLEVISTSSLKKDTEVLPDLYHKAGISEFWLVDARRNPLQFEIRVWTPTGYQLNQALEGMVYSNVFRKFFGLSFEVDHRGHPIYQLSHRDAANN